MQYRNLRAYYNFGVCARFLLDARPHTKVKGSGYVLENFKFFFECLDDLNLTVTRRVANKSLSPLKKILVKYKDNEGLTGADSKSLTDAVLEVRTTLESEIIGFGAYTTTKKRLDVEWLTNDVSQLFAPTIYNLLPEIARYDFAEAGKCIAFERPTAAAFHMLRGTEDVLRFYYKQMIRRQRVSSLMWGPIVIDLRKRTITKKYTALNNNLDNIRSSYRNPTQHPDAIYDIQQAQDLWPICVEAINKMIGVLKDEKRL